MSNFDHLLKFVSCFSGQAPSRGKEVADQRANSLCYRVAGGLARWLLGHETISSQICSSAPSSMTCHAMPSSLWTRWVLGPLNRVLNQCTRSHRKARCLEPRVSCSRLNFKDRYSHITDMKCHNVCDNALRRKRVSKTNTSRQQVARSEFPTFLTCKIIDSAWFFSSVCVCLFQKYSNSQYSQYSMHFHPICWATKGGAM